MEALTGDAPKKVTKVITRKVKRRPKGPSTSFGNDNALPPLKKKGDEEDSPDQTYHTEDDSDEVEFNNHL